MSLSQDILDKAKYWATDPVFDEKTRSEIETYLEKNAEGELTDCFYKDLEFGTGGLRGILGPGSAKMNIYNIRKASTALAQEIKKHFSNEDMKLGITHDSRRFSRDFAMAVAEVMAAHGIKTLITKELRPVPMLSFMVRKFGCKAGVCITASHNPPNYNGYKVYWQDGAQVTPPIDENIINNFNAISDYGEIKFLDYSDCLEKGIVQELGPELDSAYYSELEKLSLNKPSDDDFKIVFTPLHGTAGKPVPYALSLFGFNNVQVVPEQEKPDSNFPTVKFPNPEDPEALAMAVALAKKTKADLVLGTDPDCDRVGIVVNENGKFNYLNGNQIGCLLTEYFVSALKAANKLPEDPLVIKTIVTTDLQTDIAEHYGAHTEETLTGFKWICSVIEDYETGVRTPYKEYICGGEESYGFLAGKFVRDKDGISACCIASEMTAYYKSKGMTLTDVLNMLYRRHGVYHEVLHTVTLPGAEGAAAIKSMMESLRANPPRVIAGVNVKNLRDFKLGQEFLVNSENLEKVNDLAHPPSNVLQFILEDGTKISARPSGTEPKIKFYVSVKEKVAADVSDEDLETVKKRCQTRAGQITDTFVGFTQ